MAVTELDIRHELWRRGELSWKLDSLQLQIRNQSQELDESLTLSSRQIGKSYESVVEALEFCIKNPRSIVRVLAPNLKQVADIVEDNLTPICLDAPPGFVKRKKTQYRWQVGSSSLRLGALERQYVDANRGGNAKLIITEEGGFVPSEDYKYAYESVLGPQLMRSRGRIKHVTSPSVDEAHYIHVEILPKCELKNAVFRYEIYDSPSLSQEQIAHAKALCGGENSDAWQREYLAKIIRSTETVIVPSFSDTNNVKIIERPSHCHWTLAYDAGGARDLHGAVLCYWDFLRAKFVVFKSFRWDQGTNTKIIIKDLKTAEQELRICDWGEDWLTPSQIQTIWRVGDLPAQLQMDIASEYKYHFSVPPKNDRDAAINNIDIGFSNENIEIDYNCTDLISCLKHGRWNKHRTDFERTKALGHWDSGMALTYAYRVINKNNPFPPASIHHDTQIRVKLREDTSGEYQLAKAFSQKIRRSA